MFSKGFSLRPRTLTLRPLDLVRRFPPQAFFFFSISFRCTAQWLSIYMIYEPPLSPHSTHLPPRPLLSLSRRAATHGAPGEQGGSAQMSPPSGVVTVSSKMVILLIIAPVACLVFSVKQLVLFYRLCCNFVLPLEKNSF